MIVIDGNQQVLGRLSTVAAKELLKGEEVTIINAEKVIVSGSKNVVVAEFRKKFKTGGLRKGPYLPRAPDRIVRRVVRGMIPYGKAKGREAYKRLRVYIGTPAEYRDSKSYLSAIARENMPYKYMPLGEVSRLIGSRFNEGD